MGKRSAPWQGNWISTWWCSTSTCRGWMAWPSCAFCAPGSPSMPILVLTGCTLVVDPVLRLDLGADDYLGKPVLAVDDQKLDRVERGFASGIATRRPGAEMKMAFRQPPRFTSSSARSHPLVGQ